MRTRRLAMILAVVAMTLGAMAPAALASPTSAYDQKVAVGWGCADAVGLPAGHCVNPAVAKDFGTIIDTGIATGKGTFQLLVFDDAGSFVTAEIATFMTSADSRACPNDDESPDGSYWAFIPGILYVCHHRSE